MSKDKEFEERRSSAAGSPNMFAAMFAGPCLPMHANAVYWPM